MSKTATLKGKITLDDTPFHKGLRRAVDRAKKFGGDVASAVGGAALKAGKLGLLGLGGAGLGAAGGLMAAAKSAADLGGQLSDASAVTGIAAGKMLVLQQAFANAGMSGEGAAGVIAKLQASIGRAGFMSEEAEDEVSGLNDRISELRAMKAGMDPKEQAKVNKEIAKTQERIGELRDEAKGVAKAFKLLGLDQGMLAQMDGTDQLKTVFEAIGKMGTQADKLAALKMLRLPPELMVLAKDPNAFSGAATMLGTLPGIMDKFADKFDRVSDIMGAKFGILFNQIGAGFLSSIVDNKTFQAMLSKFEALDLSFIGEEIGTRLSGVIDLVSSAIREGNLSEVIGGLFEVAFMSSTNLLVSAMGNGIAIVGGIFQALFSDEADKFVGYLSSALMAGFEVVAFNFTKLFKLAFMEIEADFQNSALGKLMSLGKVVYGAGKSIIGAGGTTMMSTPWGNKDAAAGAYQFLKDGQKTMGEGLLNLIDGTDMDVVRARQAELLNDDRLPWSGMTQSERLSQASKDANGAAREMVNFLSVIPEKIRQLREEMNMERAMSDANRARTNSIDGVRGRLNNDAQRNALDSILYGPAATGAPVSAAVPQQQGRTPFSGMQWTFPDGSTNKGGKGDTGPKQVELLERVATLLDRNLTALQVA